MKRVFILLLLVVLIVFGFAMRHGIKGVITPAQNNAVIQPGNQATTPATKEVTVTLTANGFAPHTVTVKVGGTVFWLNSSGAPATVNSNNHPTNSLYPPLNLGRFENGAKIQLLFTQKGTYGYHDYFHPSRMGEVIVE